LGGGLESLQSFGVFTELQTGKLKSCISYNQNQSPPLGDRGMDIRKDIQWRVSLSFLLMVLVGIIVIVKAFCIQQFEGTY